MPSAVLSRAAGVSKSATANAETGAWIPLLDTLERLANALRVSPVFLAFGIEVPWEQHEGDELRCAGIGQRTKEAREARGFSMREVGRRLESAASTVQSIERGTMPRLDTAEKLAKALGVSAAWLAFGIGSMEPARRSSRRSPVASRDT